MYVDGDRNETTKCTEWQYIYGDIGHTIVSEVIARPSMSRSTCELIVFDIASIFVSSYSVDSAPYLVKFNLFYRL